ncbi:DUF3841 domain-containing protein [Solibacillus sp. FSL K6-1523]|uniref:DUF3841 domain-containing protein n=1 Tax=Solibacillus sp. FSL K6-1523 TaxID=2921471 RepID=UPI0030F57816
MVTYWTIQTMDKWKVVQNVGYLTGNAEFIWEEFVEPYKWMMAQMGNRLSNYVGEYLTWLWTERPDLRRSGHLAKGEQGVLIKVEIDDEDVLLSDFQAWHIVLNYDYMSLNVDEVDQDYSDEEIRKSWELIFELEKLKDSEGWGGLLHLQGVTGEIRASQMKIVKTFIAR